MQKKIVVLFMFLMSMMALANETVEIEKVVTGVDRQTLEQVDGVESVDAMQEDALKKVDVKLKSNDLKTQTEVLTVEEVAEDDGLEEELSKEMANDSVWKYILGGLLLLVGVAAI